MAYSGFGPNSVRPNSGFSKKVQFTFGHKHFFFSKEKIIIFLSKFFLNCWNRFYVAKWYQISNHFLIIFFFKKNCKFFSRKNARTPNEPEYTVRPNSGFSETLHTRIRHLVGESLKKNIMQYIMFKNALRYEFQA